MGEAPLLGARLEPLVRAASDVLTRNHSARTLSRILRAFFTCLAFMT